MAGGGKGCVAGSRRVWAAAPLGLLLHGRCGDTRTHASTHRHGDGQMGGKGGVGVRRERRGFRSKSCVADQKKLNSLPKRLDSPPADHETENTNHTLHIIFWMRPLLRGFGFFWSFFCLHAPLAEFRHSLPLRARRPPRNDAKWVGKRKKGEKTQCWWIKKKQTGIRKGEGAGGEEGKQQPPCTHPSTPLPSPKKANTEAN